MKKKFLSVIIVPHNKTSCRTITFSKKSLQMLIGGASIFAAVLFIFLLDYFSMGVVRMRYKSLLGESEQQRLKIVQYENSIKDLQVKLSSFDGYAKKLNIMLGLKSPDVMTSQAGVGGGGDIVEPAPGAQQVQPTGPQVYSQALLNNLNQKAESVDRNLNSLVAYSESLRARLSSTPMSMPVNGWISSNFGMRVDPFTGRTQMHSGIDISTNIGVPVEATADGLIVSVAVDRLMGKNVVISHGFGLTTQYGHLNGFNVREGQKVRRGDVIGYVGQTGKAIGPHVHYEIRLNGKPVNPLNYIFEE